MSKLRNNTARRRKKSNNSIVIWSFVALSIGFLLLRLNSTNTVSASTQVQSTSSTIIKLRVPKNLIKQGATLSSVELELKEFNKDLLPSDVVTDIYPYISKTLAMPVASGTPILKRYFASDTPTTEPTYSIKEFKVPEGMRAVSVKGDLTTIVEGFANINSTVDVVLVENGKATIIAENAKIISINGKKTALTDKSEFTKNSTVSLLVEKKQALGITSALSRGLITFILKDFADASPWGQKTFTEDDFNSEIKDPNGKRKIIKKNGIWVNG